MLSSSMGPLELNNLYSTLYQNKSLIDSLAQELPKLYNFESMIGIGFMKLTQNSWVLDRALNRYRDRVAELDTQLKSLL